MPVSKYTTFHIKNTASIPMVISLTDPDKTSHTVGPLDPGEESMQVAPIGTIWSIQFVSDEVESGKPGSDATKPGSDATKPGSDATKPGSDATKPGSDATKDVIDSLN